MEINFKM